MQDKKVYKHIVESFTEKPKFSITVPISWAQPEPPINKSLFDRLFKKPGNQEKGVETERTFIVTPCKVGNMWRLAGAASQLPDEIREGGVEEIVLPLIKDHLETIVYMVAAGIQNNHEEPKAELIKFIENNFDNDDLYACLYPVLENMRMQSFLNSIVLAKGTVNILKPKTSPIDRSE